jgi:hypothetical protein
VRVVLSERKKVAIAPQPAATLAERLALFTSDALSKEIRYLLPTVRLYESVALVEQQ